MKNTPNTFEEITMECAGTEIMVHKDSAGKFVHAYAWKDEVDAGEFPQDWQWKPSSNSAFMVLQWPDAGKAVNLLRYQGYRA